LLEALHGLEVPAGSHADAEAGDGVSEDEVDDEVVEGEVVPVLVAPEADGLVEGGVGDAVVVVVPVPPNPAEVIVGDLVAADFASRAIDDDALDPVGLANATHFLVSKDTMMSEEAESKFLECSRRQLREIRIASADVAWHLERHWWHAVERSLIEPNPNRIIAYVDFGMYDGVDLRCLTTKFWKAVGAMSPALEGPDAQGALQDLSANLRQEVLKKESADTAYGAAKIQHSLNMVGVTINIGTKVVHLIGHLSTLLLAVDRSTGEALLATCQRQDPGSSARELVARRVRVNESDGAGYNDRCEKGLVQTRPGWTRLKWSCEVHYTSNTHTKVYDLPQLSSDISGMVQTGLALREFGMIMKFRDAGRAVLKTMVHIVDDLLLDESAAPFKELVLDVFLGRGKEAMAKRGVLLKLAPGDWRIKGKWPWLRLGTETLEQVIELVLEGVTPLMWGHAPFEFPRARWVGAEKTFEDVGIPCNLHGLMYLTAQQFRRDLGEPDQPPPPPAAAPAPPIVADVLPLLPPPVVPPAPPPIAPVVLGPLVVAPEEEPDAAHRSAADEIRDAPKKNLAHRTNMLQFLASDPGKGGNTTLYTIYIVYIYMVYRLDKAMVLKHITGRTELRPLGMALCPASTKSGACRTFPRCLTSIIRHLTTLCFFIHGASRTTW